MYLFSFVMFSLLGRNVSTFYALCFFGPFNYIRVLNHMLYSFSFMFIYLFFPHFLICLSFCTVGVLAILRPNRQSSINATDIFRPFRCGGSFSFHATSSLWCNTRHHSFGPRICAPTMESISGFCISCLIHNLRFQSASYVGS